MSTSPTVGGQSSSGQATTSMILGILGIVCCQILGPVAWFLGHQELQRIRAGQSAAAGEGMAKAGMIMGIVGTVLLVLSILWIVFLGGLGMLGALKDR